ncbi:MAG TPA: sodium:proton antiporter, partial [Gammaproteobacteria bacterium]|nr:sodium:proton antiporter [Gammaproteobacteria bacterium]
LLQFWGYRIRMYEKKDVRNDEELAFLESVADIDKELLSKHYKLKRKPFDIFISMKRAEWDTLMFFYGVVLSVAGLGTLGYLALLSDALYTGLGPTWANILVGLVSAIVDNIPVMYAVLTMQPDMSQGQWLLVTLTAGVGGSLLSIGSAAGVALMGQARGDYTFFVHLRWSWAIGLGYIASIWVHFLVNAKSF